MENQNLLFDKAIGDILFRARVVKRITQDQMATLISQELKKGDRINGISRGAYAFYERGERSMPIDIFIISCKILGLEWRTEFNNALAVYDNASL